MVANDHTVYMVGHMVGAMHSNATLHLYKINIIFWRKLVLHENEIQPTQVLDGY